MVTSPVECGREFVGSVVRGQHDPGQLIAQDRQQGLPAGGKGKEERVMGGEEARREEKGGHERAQGWECGRGTRTRDTITGKAQASRPVPSPPTHLAALCPTSLPSHTWQHSAGILMLAGRMTGARLPAASEDGPLTAVCASPDRT